jgi:hypothetical protein
MPPGGYRSDQKMPDFHGVTWHSGSIGLAGEPAGKPENATINFLILKAFVVLRMLQTGTIVLCFGTSIRR